MTSSEIDLVGAPTRNDTHVTKTSSDQSESREIDDLVLFN
jgi:hypothetical protein